jgi:hypothetical protein
VCDRIKTNRIKNENRKQNTMSTSVANVVSHFPDAENGFTTTTAGSVASGATTVALNSVAGYTNGEPAVFVIEPTSASAKQTFTGIVDTAGVQITSVVWTAGTNQTHALGVTVVDYATATHIAMMSKGIKVEHAQDGTHTNITQADANYIKDDAGNELLKWSKTASAVNELTIKNAATGNAPSISATGGDTNVDLTLIPKGTGTVKTSPVNAIDWTALALGSVVQVVSTGYSAVATGTTVLPIDDTIPQNTEGFEVMTQAITPKSATNILVIEAVILAAGSTTDFINTAMFQDSAAGAIAAMSDQVDNANDINTVIIGHTMVAGTTSATTFKIRIGPNNGATTLTFNGRAGARLFGAIPKSFIKITEYKA